MKKTHWLTALIGIMAMLFLVAGCGSGSKSSAGTGGSGKVTLGFSQLGAESQWRTANTKSVQSAAKKNKKINLKFSDAQQKQENQISAIRNFIQQGVDVIAVAPVVETGWETVLKEAKDADIPVILVDRMIKGKNVDDLYSAWIGSDFTKEGRKAGDWLATYMKKQNKASEKLNIAYLQGTTGASAQVGRTKGFGEVAKEHSNWDIIEKQSGNFTREEGKEVMEAFMKSSGDKINVLVSENDDMTMGAIQAIEEAGKKPGKDITIISFDSTNDGLQAILDGKINADIECNPMSGEDVMKTAIALKDGKKVQKKVYVHESLFDIDNAKKNMPRPY
ncbi:ABC transporter substrate-binding protein [Schleiferilactobacillus harbinensis]|jgi:simple sugar transport system substrate-binding protein|uniref:ABC transporter substrate-binding protein n=1 Tax=Schleiferilactobacillus harbinensis TaxID=304207 RepID=UPI001AAE3AA3|nr:ABC transporter substrate-binding protein [Schleiferilactobacillus harbinensis]MBO3092144.1 ABC transporter substrate-binding protein [Schleiferilactobacillus harbinensis]